MKRIVFAFLSAIFLFVTVQCEKTKDKVDELTEFDINYTANLTIPSTSYTLNTPVDISTPEIPTQSANKFSEQKTAQNLVSEIKMTKFDISTTGTDLNFLKSLSIYVKTSNLGDVLVATKSNIPTGITAVSADLSGANIKEHIFKDKIQFRVTLNFNTAPSGTQNLKMDQTVRIKATILK